MAKSHKTCMEQAEIIDTFGTYQVLICPNPYFRLVNNSKQWHNHKVHEKLIKIHIRHTPNGVTGKKIQVGQVTGTCCLQREAHFSTMHNRLSNANMLQIDM